MRLCGRVVTVGASLSLLTAFGCVPGLDHRYTDLGPIEQMMYAGTQPGFHRLSPYFAASISGGTLSDRVMEIYYYPDRTSRKKLIGILAARTYESADYGPRDEHYAVSVDGRSLLYFHDDKLEYGELRKSGGLYLFRHGRGDALVRRGGERSIAIEDKQTFLSAAGG